MFRSDLPDEQQDVCEPLDTITVCQALNDSDVLCAPAGWAGDAIKDAINATMTAMRQLDRTLHFQVQYCHLPRKTLSGFRLPRSGEAVLL